MLRMSRRRGRPPGSSAQYDEGYLTGGAEDT
jgi:hypothetical protein